MTGPSSHLPIREPGRYCNARKKQEEGYCKKPAGWGTDHPGLGRCRLHGGATPYRGRGRTKVFSTVSFAEVILRAKIEHKIGMLVLTEEKIGKGMVRLFRAADKGSTKAVLRAVEKLKSSHDEIERLCERVDDMYAELSVKTGFSINSLLG